MAGGILDLERGHNDPPGLRATKYWCFTFFYTIYHFFLGSNLAADECGH